MSKIDLGHLGEAMEMFICHRMKESFLTTGFGWIHTTKLWLTSVYMCMCMWVGQWKWGHGRHLWRRCPRINVDFRKAAWEIAANQLK